MDDPGATSRLGNTPGSTYLLQEFPSLAVSARMICSLLFSVLFST